MQARRRVGLFVPRQHARERVPDPIDRQP
jgi:hypothetical protein